jgi:acyl-CoA synthetase (AMP-forming)/AMP-acid ligase II
LLFAPLHRRLGGGRPTLQCGAAPLDAAVARRFELLGIPVYTGYGLTEAAPTVAMNTPAACRHGSVGRPLPGTEVRIAGDGEIVVRSPGVMIGYWDDEALTGSVLDGAGWLHTGDLGRLDADGFLHVTGRTKSLIVLGSGKKVQPEEVEAALAPSSLLAEACVVGWAPPADGPGPGGEQVCAVVVASPRLRSRCSTPGALTAAATDEVARLAAGLAPYKRPAVVTVLDRALPRTPKRSFRRADVVDLLAGSYAGWD